MSISSQEPKPLLTLSSHRYPSTSSTTAYQDGNPDNTIGIRKSPPPSSSIHPIFQTQHPHGHNYYHKPLIKKPSGAATYMECLKNHAASIGRDATDGCGEFMAGGEEGTIEALNCSACNCHRNFHRRIQVHAEPSAPGGVYGSAWINGLAAMSGRREGGGNVERRFRTKFSLEQKEKMLGFAERAGWKLTSSKVGDSEVRRFCEEIGVNRKVLKVWMHNNKYHFANKKKTATSTN